MTMVSGCFLSHRVDTSEMRSSLLLNIEDHRQEGISCLQAGFDIASESHPKLDFTVRVHLKKLLCLHFDLRSLLRGHFLDLLL